LAFTIVTIPASAIAELGRADAPPSAPAGPQVLVPNQGTEVPPATDPVDTRHPVKSSLRTFGDIGVHHHEMQVPNEDFDRVFMIYSSWPNHPNGDPWDRTFSAGVNGTEMVHGTTTRGNFTIVEDVTEYSDRFEPGSTVDVITKLDTWEDNGIVEDVKFAFYDDPKPVTEAAEQPFDEVVSPFYFQTLEGTGDTLNGQNVAFPSDVPDRVVLEVYTSGHGACGEFWYTCPGNGLAPPSFEIRIDDRHVGTIEAMPYVYALLGLDGNDEEGSQSEEQAAFVNQNAWWSAHRGLDRAGVHHGVGEVPSYRATVPGDMLDLFTGERDVTIEQTAHEGRWFTSLNVLVDNAK